MIIIRRRIVVVVDCDSRSSIILSLLIMVMVFGRAVPDHHFVVGKTGATGAVAADEQHVVGALAGESTVVFGPRRRRCR